ncbi:MAG: outer membrane protein assembly factor BamA [Thermodesulfobacteriota bacterium]|nr:outer membrane protein assembly factor BamA [Thermodesulfobacteriota bacterium]
MSPFKSTNFRKSLYFWAFEISPLKYRERFFLETIFSLVVLLFIKGDVWPNTDEVLYIKSIKFTGVQRNFINDINKEIITKKPSRKPGCPKPVFDERILKEDIERIEYFYKNNGYYHVIVEYRLSKDFKKKIIDVEIIVNEGAPTLIGKININIRNFNNFKKKQWKERLLNVILCKDGEPFKVNDYEKSKEEIRKLLVNHGYFYAGVLGKAIVDKRHFKATITFNLDTGKLQYFGSVTIIGNKGVKSKTILKELTFKEGDIFSLTKIYESQQNIYKLGLFKSVVISPKVVQRNTKIPIQISIEEIKKKTLKVGIGYGDEDEFRFQIAWDHKNFFGAAKSLSVASKYSLLIRSITTDFNQPYFLDKNSSLGIHFGIDREYLESYTNEKILSSIKIGRTLGKNLEGFVSYKLELNRPVSVGKTVIQELKETKRDKFYWISGGEIGFRLDTVKNNIDPQEGLVCSAFLEPATFLLGSEEDYIKGVTGVRMYRKIVPGITLAARLKFGFIKPYRNTQDVPIFKRFFSGGSNSVRGYPFQELGPLDKKGDPIGGHSLVEGSLELRHSFYRELKGVFFFDIGNVYRDSFDFNISGLKFSAGWGLRYKTLIGPIRIDLAFPLNPLHEQDLSLFRFHFSIGHAF